VFTYYFLIHPFRLVPMFSGITPEGKFLRIALVIVRITLNVIVRQMPLNVR
jgi:hypothetical protein